MNHKPANNTKSLFILCVLCALSVKSLGLSALKPKWEGESFSSPFGRTRAYHLGEGLGGVLVYNSVMPVKNIIPGQNINPKKLQRARELRSEMTPAEKVLWQELRGNKLGFHFRRQQVIAGFIGDFYCHSAALIIELDGDIHRERHEYDDDRDKAFKNMGLHIVHFSNNDVLLNLQNVLIQLNEMIRII